MKNKNLIRIIFSTIIVVFAFSVVLIVTGCKKKTTTKYDKQIHNYSEVISTENISYMNIA